MLGLGTLSCICDRCLPVAAVGLIFGAWYGSKVEASARQESELTLRAYRAPYLLSGMELDYLQHAIVRKSATEPRGAIKHRLLFVEDDSCGACQRSLPGVLDFVSKVGGLGSLACEIVSLRGGRLASSIAAAMEAAHLPYGVIVPDDIGLYTRATGLVGTPTIVLLDEHSRVEALIRGVSSERLSWFAERLSEM